MNSTELRSGNLILWNGSPYRVTALDIAKLETYPDDNVKAEGIVLTEEWLDRAGFEKVYCSRFTIRYEHPKEIQFDYKFNLAENVQHVSWRGNHIQCDNVHQLQNLYFALTGQELTIKQD